MSLLLLWHDCLRPSISLIPRSWRWSLNRNASYVWRSICARRDVIMRGSRWQVGDERSIKIWEDRWLPLPSNFQIFSTKPKRMDISFVNDLISGTGSWNLPLINSLFSAVEVDLVHSLTLGKPPANNCLVWHFDKKGSFSVKSAYHVAREYITPSSASSSTSAHWSTNADFWDRL